MPLSLSSTYLLSPLTATILLLLLLLLLAVHLPPSFAQDLTTYPNCTLPFSCGSLQNITYPFTGGDRPSHCGPPEFRLTCRNNHPELTTNSFTYRVLHINQTQQTLILSRLDLWNNTCPNQFFNSTLNSSIFTYGAENQDLSLIYGCDSSPLTFRPHNVFTCNVSGVNFSDAYYLSGPLPRDPSLRLIRCFVSLTIPVLKSASDGITSNTSLGEALTEGFNVNYSDPYGGHCSECVRSGWQCGFDSNSGQPICICGDRLCIPTGPSTSLSLGSKLAIGFSISGGAVMMIFLIIFCYRGRRRISFKAGKKEQMNDKNVEAFIRNHGSLSPTRYDYFDIKKITNSFADKLGEGGYGSVFKGKLSDGRLVAVKVLTEAKGNGEDFINEVASISRTSHVNIVTLLGFCLERNRQALIYEFMPNKSLDKFICNNRSSDSSCRLDWKTLYQIAVGTARGLEYLHRGCNTRIVHFDIKPENILLDEEFCPKISDFGLAKLCQRKKSVVSMLGARGTPGYIAPEVFCRNFGEVSHKSDVYSYGMMVINMVGVVENTEVGLNCTSEAYFPDFIYKHLELGEDLRVFQGVTTEEEEETARKMVLVGLWCIQTNPADRPSMSKVVEMLEGTLQSLQIPPKPLLFSPRRPTQDSCSSLSGSYEIEVMESINQ